MWDSFFAQGLSMLAKQLPEIEGQKGYGEPDSQQSPPSLMSSRAFPRLLLQWN